MRIIDLTAEEYARAKRMERKAAELVRSLPISDEVRRSFARVYNEHWANCDTKCGQCMLERTCEKRRKHGLTGCRYAVKKKRKEA